MPLVVTKNYSKKGVLKMKQIFIILMASTLISCVSSGTGTETGTKASAVIEPEDAGNSVTATATIEPTEEKEEVIPVVEDEEEKEVEVVEKPSYHMNEDGHKTPGYEMIFDLDGYNLRGEIIAGLLIIEGMDDEIFDDIPCRTVRTYFDITVSNVPYMKTMVTEYISKATGKVVARKDNLDDSIDYPITAVKGPDMAYIDDTGKGTSWKNDNGYIETNKWSLDQGEKEFAYIKNTSKTSSGVNSLSSVVTTRFKVDESGYRHSFHGEYRLFDGNRTLIIDGERRAH